MRLRQMVLGVAVLGCGAEGAVDDEGVSDRSIMIQSGWGCRNCGFKNSARIGTHDIKDFELETSPSGAGLALSKIEDPLGARHDVEIEVSAIEAATPTGTVTGPNVVGWSLIFIDSAGFEVPVLITAHAMVPSWFDPKYEIDTYELRYAGGESSICPIPNYDGTTVVFTENERYDEPTKEVWPDESGWVTVACQGHAAAKMKFMGYDPNDGMDSSVEQRQAVLKMLTADYCGTGASHTEFGVDLDWEDPLGFFQLMWTPHGPDVEARWNEQGATCLTQPRRPSLAQHMTCSLDPCTEIHGNGELASFIP